MKMDIQQEICWKTSVSKTCLWCMMWAVRIVYFFQCCLTTVMQSLPVRSEPPSCVVHIIYKTWLYNLNEKDQIGIIIYFFQISLYYAYAIICWLLCLDSEATVLAAQTAKVLHLTFFHFLTLIRKNRRAASWPPEQIIVVMKDCKTSLLFYHYYGGVLHTKYFCCWIWIMDVTSLIWRECTCGSF